MSDPRWTDQTEVLVAETYLNSDVSTDGRREARGILTALADAGLLVTDQQDSSGPDESILMLASDVDRLTAELAHALQERDDRSAVLRDVIAQREQAYAARNEAQRRYEHEDRAHLAEVRRHDALRTEVQRIADWVYRHTLHDWAGTQSEVHRRLLAALSGPDTTEAVSG